MQRVNILAVKGGVQVVTGGVTSTTIVEGSFPGCTVSVFATGTTNLISIFGDNLFPPTPKSNPFTADANGFAFFYAVNSSRVDIQLSGTGITIPFVVAADVLVSDFSFASLNAPHVVAFSATPTFDLSQFDWFQITLTGNVTAPTFPNPVSGSILVLSIIQNAAGGNTWAWPGSFINPPAIALGSNARTECTFKFDGVNWTMLAATGDQLQAAGGTLSGTYGGNPTFSGNVQIGGTLAVSGAMTAQSSNSVVNAGSYATFALALAACPNPGTISISTPITVSANAVVPAGVTLNFYQGGRLNIPTATTVTINSAVIAPEDATIFSLTGTGAVAGLSTTRPEWFGGRAAANVLAAYNALPSTGGNILFRDATYISPWISHATEITKSNVELAGSGQPEYNSQTAPTALTAGGTIIQGPIWVMSDQTGTPANGFYIHDLGVDVGSAVCTALFSGVGQQGVFVNNNFAGGTTDGPPFIEGVIVENITTLGQSAAAAFHSILVDNGDGTRIQNVRTFFNIYGVVSKGKRTTIDGVYARGHSTAGVYIKSDTNFGISQDNTLSNIHITQAAAAYDTAGLFIESQAVQATKAAAITNFTARGTSFGINIAGTSVGVSEVSISNFKIDNTNQNAVVIGGAVSSVRVALSDGSIINSTNGDAINIASTSTDTSISNVFINSVTAGNGISNSGTRTKLSNVSVIGASAWGAICNTGSMSVEGFTGSSNVSGNITFATSANMIASLRTSLPYTIASFDAPPAQAAAIGTTTLNSQALVAGQYRLSYDAKITQAATTSSVLGPLTATWTDPDGTAITTVIGLMVNGGTTTSTGPTNNNTVTIALGIPVTFNVKLNTNVTFSFAYTSVGATPMQYNLHVKLEAL